MVNEVVVLAPAKVNIGLRVLPARQDGFHNLESIFQTVSLSDKLTVLKNPASKDFECKVSCEQMILPEKNTITMAYDAFFRITGCKQFSVKVELEKHIPDGGGLGGGSSDAASFLRALECLSGVKLSREQLDAISAKVGSDVFFFTHCSSFGECCAVVTGRGENVRDIKKRKDLFFVLVFPGVHSSTKEAYSLVDNFLALGKSIEYPEEQSLEKMYFSPVRTWKFKNTFSEALRQKYPEIQMALKKVEETKPLYFEMSGSGSTIYGIYASWEEADRSAKILNDEGLKCVVTQ